MKAPRDEAPGAGGNGREQEISPSRQDAIREIARLAAFDLRRGVGFWFDEELTEDLRALTLGDNPSPAVGRPEAPSRAADADPGPARGPHAADTRPGSSQPSPVADTRPGSSQPSPVADTRSAPAERSPRDVRPAEPPRSASRARVPTWGAPPLAAGRDADWTERLRAAEQRASDCRRCGLCETRNKVVFGVGSAQVPLVFVGEAPGADEDRQGFPFVGKAGQLLDKIIQAIGLERDEIYICNVLKCRPPGNRNPAPDEIAKCTPFLEEQLTILKPKVICTLGLFASQFLTGTELPIGKLRGRVLDYRGTPLIPTYHPAALLRNPGLKPAVWEDVQLVRRTLDG